MRKTILASVLGLTLLMGACTGADTNNNKADNINFYTAAEKNQRDELNVSGKTVESEDFKMNLEFTKNMVRVGITNTSDEVMVVDWDHARYTGLDGEEQKIFDMKQKDNGFYARQKAIPLRPGQSYIAELVPVGNLHHTPGSSTGLGTIYIEKDLFAAEKALQKQDFAKIEIPITVGGVKKGTLRKYEVYFGEGDMPVRLEESLEARTAAPAPAAAPAPVAKPAEPVLEIQSEDALKIKSENELLEEEIRSKEALIEQLEEKARLQKELEEKQKEIDALMKGLN